MVLSEQGCEAFTLVNRTWNFKLLMYATQTWWDFGRKFVNDNIHLVCKLFLLYTWKRSSISFVKSLSFRKTFPTWTSSLIRENFKLLSFIQSIDSPYNLLLYPQLFPKGSWTMLLSTCSKTRLRFTSPCTQPPLTLSPSTAYRSCVSKEFIMAEQQNIFLFLSFLFRWMAKRELEKNQ